MASCCVCLETATHKFVGAPVCGEAHARSFYNTMRASDRTRVNDGQHLSELKVHYYTLGAAFDLKRVVELSQEYDNFVRIGRGGNAQIYRATSVADGQTYALKIFTPGRSVESVRSDFVNLLELRHRILDDYQDEAMLRNLPNVYDAFRANTPYYSTPSFVVKMEYVRGQSLSDYMEAAKNNREFIDMDAWFRFAYSAFDLLQTMHAIGMVHGDIKGDNIMVRQTDPDELKLQKLDRNFVLIDFGLSCQETGCDTHVTGTLLFMGPDLIGYPYAREFSNYVRNLPSKQRLLMFMSEDVYALATTLFNALCAEKLSPFQRRVRNAMRAQENVPFDSRDRVAVDDMNRRRREAAVAMFTPDELKPNLHWMVSRNTYAIPFKPYLQRIYDATIAAQYGTRSNAVDVMVLIKTLQRQLQ